MAVEAVPLLTEVLKVYSPTKKEGKLARLLARRMEQLGYSKVRVDEAGNVLGHVGSGKTRILLCGHMDTVPGNLPVRVGKGRISGRGAVDAKAPLCALIIAGSRLRDMKLATLTVACATREEGDSLGIKTIINSGTKYDFAIFGEPGGAGKITVGYRGRIGTLVTTRTGGGHASSPWAHPSAFDAALKLLERLKGYESEHSVADDRFHSLSIAVTGVRAGTYHNVLPSICRMTLDVRVPPGMKSEDVKRDFSSIVRESAASTGAASAGVEFDEPTEPYEADVLSVLVRAFRRAIILQNKSKPVMIRKSGTGDMNTMASVRGTTCITYGPGETSLAHTRGEYVLVDDYLTSIDTLTEAIKQLVQIKGPT
ncbi:MAG: M20/M25/M40 family metallo-hydrolase [Thaumarchaeota archaeon]|nr:M20/M25/M40 family metallo-hydrolase [Nitrososphaerota archaeon]